MYLGTALDTTTGSFDQAEAYPPQSEPYTVKVTGFTLQPPAPSAQPLLIVGAVLLGLWMLNR